MTTSSEASVPTDVSWQADAACADAEGNWFADPGKRGRLTTGAEEAMAVCRGCPVQEACLDYALGFERD